MRLKRKKKKEKKRKVNYRPVAKGTRSAGEIGRGADSSADRARNGGVEIRIRIGYAHRCDGQVLHVHQRRDVVHFHLGREEWVGRPGRPEHGFTFFAAPT